MKLNIKQHAAQDTAVIDLLDGQGEPLMTDDDPPLPVTATIYGPGSKQHANAVARSQARHIKANRERKGREATPEEKTAHQAELLADVTLSLNNLEYGELQGREMHVAVYSDTSLGFIAERINRCSIDWSVFTKPSSKS